MSSMCRHHLLFDIASDERFVGALSTLAARHRLAFGAVQTMTPRTAPRPEADKHDDRVPVWRWFGSLREFEQSAREILNGLVYPLARSRRGACLVFPFPSSTLEPRALRVEQRRGLDLEDIAALFAAANGDADRADTEVDTERQAAALQGLDPDQRAAALHDRGPARVLAAAGSGKTKTMVARIGSLVASGVRPQAILVLAFNTEAAVQLEERLAAVGVPTTRSIDPTADGVHCATFNAFGYRFQRQILGDAPAVMLSEAEHDRVLRAALTPASAEAAAPFSEARPHRTVARTAAADPYDAAATDAAWALSRSLTTWRAELRPPRPEHREALRRHAGIQSARGVQAFDDQILAAVTALLAEPGHRRLVQGLYDHVLVDEFQDVNPTQAALLDIISRPWRNLFVVGDDDQLIYGWRSADVSTIVEFGDGLPAAPFTAYYTLPTNYRCSHEIVARAERLVLNNRRRAQKSMRARPAAPDGEVLFAAGERSADRVLEAAAFLSLEQARLGCPWRELAVLCRFRSQLVPVARALREAGVPADGDAAAGGLDPACAARLDVALQEAAADPLRAIAPASPFLEEAIERLDRADRQGRPTVDEGRSPIHCRAAYGERASGCVGSPAAADAALLQVADAARLLACSHPTVAGLAASWRRLMDRQTGGDSRAPDALTMATIHATKGREYHSVVIVDFAPALEPLGDDEREEERRVLYVALTRARERALLTVDTSRGETHPFLVEMLSPPERAESRRLRAALGRSLDGLGRATAALPAPAAIVLGGHGRSLRLSPPLPSTEGAPPPPCPADLAVRAADCLALRSRLEERRLGARQGLRQIVAAWLG